VHLVDTGIIRSDKSVLFVFKCSLRKSDIRVGGEVTLKFSLAVFYEM
jgi:hypothetical protein